MVSLKGDNDHQQDELDRVAENADEGSTNILNGLRV